MAGRRPEWLGPRRNFTEAVKRQARERADGRCEGCGEPFAPDDPQEVDHDVPDGLGGDNTLENAKVLGSVACLCHPKKSADERIRMLKADKQGGRVGRNRKKRKIKSRGFQTNRDSEWKKPVNGPARRR